MKIYTYIGFFLLACLCVHTNNAHAFYINNVPQRSPKPKPPLTFAAPPPRLKNPPAKNKALITEGTMASSDTHGMATGAVSSGVLGPARTGVSANTRARVQKAFRAHLAKTRSEREGAQMPVVGG